MLKLWQPYGDTSSNWPVGYPHMDRTCSVLSTLCFSAGPRLAETSRLDCTRNNRPSGPPAVLPVARPFKRPRPFSSTRPAAPPPPVLSRASLFLLQSAALAACWLVSSRGLAGPSRLLPCLWFRICSFPLSLPPLCFFNQAQ